jgi:fructokinase
MPTIFTLGETIFDIIFRQNQPVAAKPGGSMLNTAVSLGRCGLKVEMMTELGQDRVGRLVLDFLSENGVSTSFIKPTAGFKTPVSLAFLDEQGNAQYSFYKNYPEDRLNFIWPEASRGDVVLFGSFYSLDQAIRPKIISFIKKARQNGAIIIYDPNIRKNHLEEIRKLMHFVEENISLADIVRGSDEDFENLFGTNNPDEVFARIRENGNASLIMTRNKYGVDLLSSSLKIHVDVPEIQAVSTIGAGDAFNAGIIFGLFNKGVTVNDLVDINTELWTEMTGFGITFASEVCRSFDNYISIESGKIARG